jgi:hypothetical protein
VAVRHRMLAGTAGAALLAGALALSAGGGTATAATGKAQIAAVCNDVAAVLSDGPDPGADPVGYAEAQIRQLRMVKTSDKSLKKTIDNLAAAYEAFYRDNGDATAKKLTKSAIKKMNAACPGSGAAL